MSQPQLKWTKDPLRRERFLGQLIINISPNIRRDDPENLGLRVINALKDFDAQMAARMMTVTMEDGSQELRFAKAIDPAFDGEDNRMSKALAVEPELMDGEIVVQDVTGKIFIYKEPR